MKRILSMTLSVLLAIAIVAGQFIGAPPVARAVADSSDELLFSDSGVHGGIPGDTISNNGGVYTPASNCWEWNSNTRVLTIDNFSYETTADYGIRFNLTAGDATIVLNGDVRITGEKAAVRGDGTTITIGGNGHLLATAMRSDGYGIEVEDGDLEILDPAEVAAIGFKAIYVSNGDVAVSGKFVYALGTGYGIQTVDGAITINGGKVLATVTGSNTTAIESDTDLVISGDAIVTATAGNAAIRSVNGGIVINTSGSVTATGGQVGLVSGGRGTHRSIDIISGDVTATGGWVDVMAMGSISIDALALYNGQNGSADYVTVLNTANMINVYSLGCGRAFSTSIAGNTVTVTGTLNGAPTLMGLDIPTGVTVIWDATLKGTFHPLINLVGEGLLVISDTGVIEASGGAAIGKRGTVSVLAEPGATLSPASGAYLVEFDASSGTATGKYTQPGIGDVPILTGTRITGEWTVTLTAPSAGSYLWSGAGTNGQTTQSITLVPLTGDVNALVTVSAGGGNGGGGNGGGGSNDKHYTVSFDTAGARAVKPQSVASGDAATKPADPIRAGYVFSGWFTDTQLTKAYDFTAKVTKDFTLYAKWTQAGGDTDEDAESPLENGEFVWYIQGDDQGNARADDHVTRAEIAVVFYRLLADPNKGDPIEGAYPDVESGMWYAQAINRLTEMGILTGYPDGTFRPNGFITRAELTAIIARLEKLTLETTNPFADVTDAHWAHGYISAVYIKGWVSGYPGGTFKPDALASRAEAVKMINAELGREYDAEKLPTESPFPDLDTTHWAYGEIIAATAYGENVL
jgi:uncharacterized repeat protein (TIGR02543 family)